MGEKDVPDITSWFENHSDAIAGGEINIGI
jgi:hypothetical protein